MAVAFPDINPYHELGVKESASPLDIKKAYKKLCLKFHPDKLQQSFDEISDKDKFPRIQFAYSIVSDPVKRSRYDATGSLSESDLGEDGFDWKLYFELMNDKITIDMINEDKSRYQGSSEEKSDILENFAYYDGDFLKLFEVIPHLEFDEGQENRVFELIETSLQNGDLDVVPSVSKSFDRYKKSRKTKVRQMLKKLAKEAKEAEELEKTIKDKKSRLGDENDLKSLIQSRQSNRLDNLINSLESKYVNKRGKKRKEMTDEEFEKIQKGLKKKSK